MQSKKRSKQIALRLSECEYEHLKRQSDNAGLKMEPFIRNLIMGADIRPRPPTEYAGLLRELSAIGNNFNQLVRVMNATHEVTPTQIEDCRYMFNQMWRLVKDTL